MLKRNLGSAVTIKEALYPKSARNPRLGNVDGKWPEFYGINLDDLRTCQLIACQSSDVLPYASAYSRHFGLDPKSEEFEMLCRSISMSHRQIYPILPAARLVDVTDADAPSSSSAGTSSGLQIPATATIVSRLQIPASLARASTTAAQNQVQAGASPAPP
ncbi:hypothetical protein A4X13_0g9617 [Tilletia indica]|uniref:Uncharacterized protein n=1 Tax=Tilletia indica TaxID=43049 RepID=A0A8T8S8H3_9BASI|nr:hypothetical protein A4X13_0g9617 [Tilletia indica]